MLKSFGFDELAFYVCNQAEGSVGDDDSWDKATKSLMVWHLIKKNLKYEIA